MKMGHKGANSCIIKSTGVCVTDETGNTWSAQWGYSHCSVKNPVAGRERRVCNYCAQCWRVLGWKNGAVGAEGGFSQEWKAGGLWIRWPQWSWWGRALVLTD